MRPWIAGHVLSRAESETIGNPAQDGTSDPTAVVDQYCRVHGLEGLRVVDTSIMPDIVCTGTSGTAMMIGERVADLMKEQL